MPAPWSATKRSAPLRPSCGSRARTRSTRRGSSSGASPPFGSGTLAVRQAPAARPRRSTTRSTTRSAMRRWVVSFPPAIETRPASLTMISSFREISDGRLPSSWRSGRSPAHAATTSARASGGPTKVRLAASSR